MPVQNADAQTEFAELMDACLTIIGRAKEVARSGGTADDVLKCGIDETDKCCKKLKDKKKDKDKS